MTIGPKSNCKLLLSGPRKLGDLRAGAIVTGLFCVLTQAPALAVGFRLPNQDPEAIARGNAFVATADNPSAVYYNPAGITQLPGQNFQVGLYLLDVNVDYKSPAGLKTSNDSHLQPLPQVYYTYSMADLPLSFGLGCYVPYGLGLEYPENSVFRPLAIKGQLVYATVNPVMAWQIHPALSVGIGPTLNYSEAYLKQGIAAIPGGYFKFQGDAFEPGFDAGVRWQPLSRWSFGLKYHYLTSMEYEGHSQINPITPSVNSRAHIQFPQFVTGGVSFRPTDKWNLEVNIDWTDWDNVNEIGFKAPGLPITPVFPLGWKSTFLYEVGVTRQLGQGFALSVGYFYSENSVPDRTFNPIVPDADLHLGCIGVSQRGKRWHWSLAYQLASGARDVGSNIYGSLAEGHYSVFNQAVNLAAGLRF